MRKTIAGREITCSPTHENVITWVEGTNTSFPCLFKLIKLRQTQPRKILTFSRGSLELSAGSSTIKTQVLEGLQTISPASEDFESDPRTNLRKTHREFGEKDENLRCYCACCPERAGVLARWLGDESNDRWTSDSFVRSLGSAGDGELEQQLGRR